MKKNKPISEESVSPIKINRNRDSGKKKVDLFARLRNTEHPLDNILSESLESENDKAQPSAHIPITDSKYPDNQPNQDNVDDIDNLPNIYNQGNIANQPNIHNITNPANTTNVTNPTNAKSILQNRSSSPISPVKDYTKVANSIIREAVPGRLFRGMSKNTYDALYLKTRGAIRPTRKIRATKSDLMRWSGVSDITIDKHLKHLKSVGLIKVEFMIGSHEGNWYEVFIPEEISADTQPNQPDQPITNFGGGQATNFLGVGIPTQTIENKEKADASKTLFKTKPGDDEGFAKFIEIFQKAATEISGKNLSKRDEENLANLAELLTLELKIAARRTENVSSVPAFLTEVLRRKLRNLPTQPKNTKIKSDTVGEPIKEPYEIKALTAKEREATLQQLSEFAEDEYLHEFKRWYTQDDWNWLLEQLLKK